MVGGISNSFYDGNKIYAYKNFVNKQLLSMNTVYLAAVVLMQPLKQYLS